jgi:hypothetical protein
MPTISDSTITINKTNSDGTATTNSALGALNVPSPPSNGVTPTPISVPIRGALPSNNVLDTVTASTFTTQSVGVPSTASWKSNITAPITATVQVTSSIPDAAPQATSGVPQQVHSVSATATPYKTTSGQMESLVSVTFTPNPLDPYFAGVQIWFTGYNGISNAQLMAQGFQSPVEFLCQTTGENVTVTVVAVGGSGLSASFADAPTTTVTLSGVMSAPPAPTVAQGTVAIGSGLGWQFSWNVENGLLNDIVSGYWVYSNTVNVAPTAPSGRVQYCQQPATNIGTITYQELTSATKYYWVSAVNSSGLESTLTSVNTTTVVASYYPIATSIESNYSNLSQAYDGNETTSAGFSQQAPMGSSVSASMAIQGFHAPPSGVTVTKIELKVLSDASMYDDSAASITYSLDAGATWTPVYDLTNSYQWSYGFGAYPVDNWDSRPKQYDTISIPTSTDLTHIYVQASASADSQHMDIQSPNGEDWTIPFDMWGTITHNLYECRIDVTYQTIA